MPTYGYRCQSCASEFERFQKITDPALTTCESCGGALKKLLYPVGIQFKGSGFYVNDYSKSGGGGKSGGTTESASSESRPAESGSDSSSGSTTSTESKTPAAPSAPASGSTTS